MIRLLLADDHRLVRAGLKQLLDDAGDLEVAAEAASGQEVLDLVAAHHARNTAVDLVLLDIAMPGLDGLEVLQALKHTWPTLPVLMLSTYPEQQYAVRCLKLGAAGYVHKAADPEALLAAVREAAQGRVYVNATVAQQLAASVGAQRGKPAKTGTDALSHREHQVFRLLATGLSVSEIGARLQLAPNTVSTYRARILEKTGTRNDVELALLAARQPDGTREL